MLGCIQPMSSPMMKRMLGLACCCCAAAGMLVTVTATNNASRPSQMPLAMTIINLLMMFSVRYGPLQPAPILRLRQPRPMRKQSQPYDKLGKEPVQFFLCSKFAHARNLRMLGTDARVYASLCV